MRSPAGGRAAAPAGWVAALPARRPVEVERRSAELGAVAPGERAAAMPALSRPSACDRSGTAAGFTSL